MTPFALPAPDLQIAFAARLGELRSLMLLDALLATVGTLPTADLDRELSQYADPIALRTLAGFGVRGEVAFAVPMVLTANPRLLGYYRLLLGYSQKEFFTTKTGCSRLRRMEEGGELPTDPTSWLPTLCTEFGRASAHLLSRLTLFDQRIAHDLTLLTLGTQFRGQKLNEFGETATQQVFDLIRAIVQPAIESETPRTLRIRNASGRVVRIEFASDPDITVREESTAFQMDNLVAIEIKGGKDVSNIHNRIGEAEKSHQKARADGYVECWTIVGVANLDVSKARRGSPSTNRFFHLRQLLDTASAEFAAFRNSLQSRLGIPSAPAPKRRKKR